jgi:hypothetical protein
VSKLDEVYGDLRPTLIKLMDKRLTNGVLAVLSIHAEDVGKEILDKAGTTQPATGIIILPKERRSVKSD